MTKNEKIMAVIMFKSLENSSPTNIRNVFRSTTQDYTKAMTPFIKNRIMELTEKPIWASGDWAKAYIDVIDKESPLFTPDEFIKIISAFNYSWEYIGRLSRVTGKMSPEFYMDHSELLSKHYKKLARIHPEIKSDSNKLLYELEHMDGVSISDAKNYSLGKEMQTMDIEGFKNHIEKFSVCKMMQKSNIEFLKKHHDYVEVLLEHGGSTHDQFMEKCIDKLDEKTFKEIITADEMYKYICDEIIEPDSIYVNSHFRGYRFDLSTWGGKKAYQTLCEKHLEDYIPFSEEEKKNFYNNITTMFDIYSKWTGYTYELSKRLDDAMTDYPKLRVEDGYNGSFNAARTKAVEAFSKMLREKDYSAEFIKANESLMK